METSRRMSEKPVTPPGDARDANVANVDVARPSRRQAAISVPIASSSAAMPGRSGVSLNPATT